METDETYINKRCSATHPNYPDVQCVRHGGDCPTGEHIAEVGKAPKRHLIAFDENGALPPPKTMFPHLV